MRRAVFEEKIEADAVFADHLQQPTDVIDKGYRGVEVPHVHIPRSGQRRGMTKSLRAMIKRRSAIKPTIGHMKMDGRLG